MYPRNEYVEEGGLMFYGASINDLFRRAAVYVDKILKENWPTCRSSNLRSLNS